MASCRSIDGTIFTPRSRPLKLVCRYANKDVPVVSAGNDRYVRMGLRRASSALLLTEPRGERASAALPHRRRNGALNAPCLKRDRRPRRAPKVGPAGPKVSRTPTPPPKAGKGALRRAHSGSPGFFGSALKFAVLVRAVAANDGGLLFGRRLHVREYALGALLCERAAAWRALATAMHDGKRRSRYRGWRDRGGPCRSQYRASEWIAGAGPPDVSGAGPAGFFVSGRRLVICGRIEFQR